MKILFVGDIYKNTGPSNVNKSYMKYLKHKMIFLKQRKKPLLLLELILRIFQSSSIVVSGTGTSSFLAVKFAALLKKPVAYLMHGCYAYECEVNRVTPNQQAMNMEITIMKNAYQVICVSERFSQWVERRYPEYRNKISFVNTGVEWNFHNSSEPEMPARDSMMIVTMGGGRPQKNNLIISQAVEMLNNTYQQPFHLLVLGRDGVDTEAIKKQSHTTYVGQVGQNEVEQYLKKCVMFVQNSTLESFSLGVVDALRFGCNVLVSQNIGALSIIPNIENCDVINNCMDVNEVAEKIRYLSCNGNHGRLFNSIDKEKTSMQTSADQLYKLVSK